MTSNFDFSGASPAISVIVFFVTAFSDMLWTLYIRRTGEGRAFSAALFTLFIALFGGIAVTEYVANSFYLIPTALGAFAGTWVTVRWDLRKKLGDVKT